MATNKLEVVYATAERQVVKHLEMEIGATIEQAIQASGILDVFPEIDINRQKIGVFSKARALTDLVQDGDRIEIYRPLTIDPKEARRLKAKKR